MSPLAYAQITWWMWLLWWQPDTNKEKKETHND
jgi:hypothetical protein